MPCDRAIDLQFPGQPIWAQRVYEIPASVPSTELNPTLRSVDTHGPVIGLLHSLEDELYRDLFCNRPTGGHLLDGSSKIWVVWDRGCPLPYSRQVAGVPIARKAQCLCHYQAYLS